MAVVEALFRAQPAFGWLVVACVLLSAELASAKVRFAWGALAALAPALLAAAHVSLGRTGEVVLFVGLTAVANVLFARERRAIYARAPRIPPEHGLPTPTAGPAPTSPIERFGRQRTRPALDKAAVGAVGRAVLPAKAKPQLRASTAPAGDPVRARALVGQTARTLTEFSNGLGRVWIAGAEWGAELVAGETLASDAPVQVIGVSGGVRLRVQAVAS